MSASPDVVLAYWSEHRQQLRQSETQRAVLTNYLLVITAGLSGFVVQQKFAAVTLPVAILIIGIGLYGAVSSAKYHERAQYHLVQARALPKTLKDMGALADDRHIEEFRKAHYRAYPRLSGIHLHWLWTGLHLAISIYGLAFLLIIILR